jgi:uncharacterized protein YecE (DUF72 family)
MNMVNKQGQVWIGTSNTTVPGNKTTFPPAFQNRSRLHYYASIFNSVEINSCFYKTPQLSTYEKWALDVPQDFRFTLKLSKLITHSKEIMVDLLCMENFLRTAYGTGEKKGCLLIQFPGKLSLDGFEKVERILHHLSEHDPLNAWRKAVEFRNPSWYSGETVEMLDEFNATMVMHDHPKAKNFETITKANFIYLRYHGHKGNYRESYTPEFLRSQAQLIEAWKKEGKEIFVYFNNTIGDAFENALYLKTLLAT